MLKKIFRLTSSKDISVTSLRGRSFFSPYFVVKFAASSEPKVRLAVIVSTKVSKRAVERNRLKRIIREELRKSLTLFRPGDYVIIVKQRAAGQVASEIKHNLDQLLTSTRLKKQS
jgi:ribonuclease P protein component